MKHTVQKVSHHHIQVEYVQDITYVSVTLKTNRKKETPVVVPT